MNVKRIFTILTGITLVIVLVIFFMLATKKQVAAPTILEILQESTASAPVPRFAGSDEILKDALNLYIDKKKAGVDMSTGPCLGAISPDWVLDIAHNPRTPQDNEPQNQCVDFTEGKAHHFVELDPNGMLLNSQ